MIAANSLFGPRRGIAASPSAAARARQWCEGLSVRGPAPVVTGGAARMHLREYSSTAYATAASIAACPTASSSSPVQASPDRQVEGHMLHVINRHVAVAASLRAADANIENEYSG
jgi:hypothetical protein